MRYPRVRAPDFGTAVPSGFLFVVDLVAAKIEIFANVIQKQIDGGQGDRGWWKLIIRSAETHLNLLGQPFRKLLFSNLESVSSRSLIICAPYMQHPCLRLSEKIAADLLIFLACTAASPYPAGFNR